MAQSQQNNTSSSSSLSSYLYSFVGGTKTPTTTMNPQQQQHLGEYDMKPLSQPLAIRYSKFTQVRLKSLLNLLPSEVSPTVRQEIIGETNNTKMVTCLLLSTESSFQIWLLNPATNTQECLFCKSLPEVAQVDFVHLPDLSSIDQQMTFTTDDYGEDREILERLSPLIAYVTHDNKKQLNVFSLVKEQTIGTVQGTAAIRKFATSLTNSTYKLILMQLDGTLMVVDLLTMATETQFRSFCLEPTLLQSFNIDQQNQVLQDGQSSRVDMRTVYDGAELRTKTDLLLMSSGFPIDFDVAHNLVAFVYTEINEESMVESMLKTLETSSLGQNMYLKEAASKLVHFSHSSLETIGNLLNANKASNIGEHDSMGNLIPAGGQESTGLLSCKCNKSKKVRKGHSSGGLLDQSNTSVNSSLLSQGGRAATIGTGKTSSRLNRNQVKSTIATENVMQVRVHRLDQAGEFDQVCTITPPFLKHISQLRFSPSGRYLLIGNESGQYFYVYELWPSTERRYNQCEGFCTKVSASLKFTLFRGFRHAMISDIQFLAPGHSEPDSETVVINSLNGTSHVFRLNSVDANRPIYNGTTGGAAAPDQRTATQSSSSNTKVQNLVASCTYRHRQVMSSMVDGGRRLLNQIGGVSYEPQAEVRLVSQVFSRSGGASATAGNRSGSTTDGKKETVATVVTYTSKNELVTFNANLDDTKSPVSSIPQSSATTSSSSRQRINSLEDQGQAAAEEQAMRQMVLESSQNHDRHSSVASQQSSVSQQQHPMSTREVSRVQLNLATAIQQDQQHLKHLTTLKLFESQRQEQAAINTNKASTKMGTSGFSNARLGRFEAETVYQRVIPRFVQDQHLKVLIQTDQFVARQQPLDIDSSSAGEEEDCDIFAQIEGLAQLATEGDDQEEEAKHRDGNFHSLLNHDYFQKPPALAEEENEDNHCILEEVSEPFEEIKREEILQVPQQPSRSSDHHLEEQPIILSKSEVIDDSQPYLRQAQEKRQEFAGRETLKVNINESNVFIKEDADHDDDDEFELARESSELGDDDFMFENPHFSEADFNKDGVSKGASTNSKVAQAKKMIGTSKIEDTLALSKVSSIQADDTQLKDQFYRLEESASNQQPGDDGQLQQQLVALKDDGGKRPQQEEVEETKDFEFNLDSNYFCD